MTGVSLGKGLPLGALCPDHADDADNALREEQGDKHEDEAESVQPAVREDAGEYGLRVVDEDRSDNRAVERGASADRNPDDDLNRVYRVELARVDDADLRDIERPAMPASMAATVKIASLKYSTR